MNILMIRITVYTVGKVPIIVTVIIMGNVCIFQDPPSMFGE